MPGAGASLVAAAAAGAAAAVVSLGGPLPLVEAGSAAEAPRLVPGWRVVGLPKQSKPFTRFTPERVDERPALRIEAQSSYGNLVHEVSGVALPQRLAWAWRLQQALPGTNLLTKGGDDVPVKVCLSFDLPLDKVPFGERQLLRLARLAAGEPLPSATLCWVWGKAEAHGAFIDNAFTRRVRYVVLRNATDPSGTWLEERRDIAADFLRAFADETREVPPLVAVLVGADADNTAGHSVAHVAALRFEP